MRLPGYKRVRQSARWLRSRFTTGGLILGYHRVADVGCDSLGMSVSVHHFAEQLAVLCRLAWPIPLQLLVDGLQNGRLPRRAVALTFDDGYADLLYQAQPLLEQYGIPATVFVVSGSLGRRFAWDETAVAGAGAESVRALSRDELVRLAGSGLITIGAHSVTHPELATRSAAEQRFEIQQSKVELEALLQRPVTGFSYPHGSASVTASRLVREAGYHYACGSATDVARPGSNQFLLPRFWVADWDGARFARWLTAWLHD